MIQTTFFSFIRLTYDGNNINFHWIVCLFRRKRREKL